MLVTNSGRKLYSVASDLDALALRLARGRQLGPAAAPGPAAARALLSVLALGVAVAHRSAAAAAGGARVRLPRRPRRQPLDVQLRKETAQISRFSPPTSP